MRPRPRGSVTGCSRPGSCLGWNGSSGPTKGANRDRDHQSVPGGQLRPGSRRGDGHRSAGDRPRARGACRAAICATGPIPSRPRSPRPTTGSPATAWCTGSGCATAGPSGTATAGCAPPPWRRRSARSPAPGAVHAGMDFAPNTNVIGHAGRTFAIVEAGARPVRADRRARDDRPLRLRRHARGRLHRAPQARPAHGRALRRVLLLRLGQRRRGDGPRCRRPRCAPAGASPWAAR